ncbi:MAG: hypothetical protein E6I01_12895 [Chloroflexi bacterium]|nr:MAG: hypothetical protein E6I01_12895 [Chloroflexota bacterium]
MGVQPAQVKATIGADESAPTWICRRCGRPARVEKPQACPVCEGTSFQPVDKAAMVAVATREGGVEEEEAFDGFKVKWTAEAKEVLNRVPKGYERRRVKARIEKIARVQRLPSITRDFADANLDEAYGPVAEVVSDTVPQVKPAGETPLTWTDEAVQRMERVPGGFMRMMARTKVEEFARKIRAETITGDVVEGGLVDARMMMDQALKVHSPEVVRAAMQAHGHHDENAAATREPSPGWTEDGVRRLNEVEIRAEEKFAPSRARELAQHAAESRAARTSEAINAAFLERLGIKIGYGHPLSPKTFEHYFTWSPEAEARLANLPSYCRELSRWRVEWTAAKKGLGPVITPAAMDVKFEMWGEVSDALQQKGPQMPWEPAAEKRLENMPPFVKGQVMAALEGNAQALGEDRVTTKVMDAVIQKWIETGDFHEGRYGFRA